MPLAALVLACLPAAPPADPAMGYLYQPAFSVDYALRGPPRPYAPQPGDIFLAHGGDDLISPPEHSVVMYLALKRAGIPAELHVYAGVAHDFGVRRNDRPCSTWTRSCADWLRGQGFLKPAP